MNFRILTTLSVLTFCLGFFTSCKTGKSKDLVSEKMEPTVRPNIIYIMADDLTTQAISAYGGIYKDIAPTPNIDKIAKEGSLFKKF